MKFRFILCFALLCIVSTHVAAQNTTATQNLPSFPSPQSVNKVANHQETRQNDEVFVVEEQFTPESDLPEIDAPLEPSVAPVKPAVKPPTQTATRNEPLRQITQRMNLALPLPQGRIVVYKSQRKLELWNGQSLVKTYRVALGANPSGHKTQRGDSRTPEGQFFICTRNAKTSAFHIFLGLSYPALPDASRGVNKKQITPREYQAIRSRLASRNAPLWSTRLGGWVGIHGGSDAAYAKKMMTKRGRNDWTAGCVALTNREIEEIYAATKMGTPVLVKP
jgi:hypothetical protein